MEINGSWVKGDWIQTYTGKQFWPLDPQVEDIDIEDIAHSLSMQCRYGGHCKRFYSVAEHCAHVSDNVPAEDALWALLHDAAEAYLVDVPRPIKKHLAGYKEIEANLMRVICQRFQLPEEMPQSVHRADNIILLDERDQNLSSPPAAWSCESSERLGLRLRFWSNNLAEGVFLNRFNQLRTA